MLDTVSMAEQLSGEYRIVFERADIYSLTAKCTIECRDDKMMELYDLLMEAEHEGRPIEKIIGSDIELFCDNFFEEEEQHKLQEMLDWMFRTMFILLVYAFVGLILVEKKSDMLPLIVGFLAGNIVDGLIRYWLQPVVFKNKKIKPIVYSFIILFVFFVTLLGMGLLTYKYEVTVPTGWLFGISATYVVIYFVLRSIYRYRKHGNIFGRDSEEKRIKKEFNKEVFEMSLVAPVAKGMATRYRRIQKRKQRQGKQEYTFWDFVQKVRSEEALNEKIYFWLTVATVLMVIVLSISIMLDGTIVDGFIFMGILGVVEYLWIRFWVKSSKDGIKVQLSILEECEQQGIDILEYVEKIKKK